MSIDNPVDTERITNLSHQQMLMWTGQQLDPTAPIYNMAFFIEIPKAIDVLGFRQSFDTIVRHSKSMRMFVELIQGIPRLRLNDELDYEVDELDFSNSTAPRIDAKAWCEARCQRQIDLENCLFDTALIKLSDTDFGWYICQHHLISDAWGATQLWRLLSQTYAQRKIGSQEEDLELAPEFPVAELKSVISDRIVAHVYAPTEFYGRRITRVRSNSQRLPLVSRGDHVSQQLAKLFSAEAAKSFSAELSQFNVVLTLLFAYLNRVSGQRALTVGVPFHNRLTRETKATLGMFIRFYSISIEVTHDETFRSLLNKVQIAANRYLREATTGQSRARSNAEFNTILNFINARFGKFDGVPVNAQWLHPGCSDRQHHLRLHVEKFSDDDQPNLNIDFNCDVFTPSQRQFAVGHFQGLITAMAADLDRPIATVDLLSADEREFQLIAFNDTGDSPKENIRSRLSRIADYYSDQTAIICRSDELSYRELNQKVEVVERTLASVGLAHGDKVAICLERSVEAVVAILAVLKAGYVFVPLDPSWPQARIDIVIANCGGKCVLSKTNHLFDWPKNVVRIDLDRDHNPSALPMAACTAPGQSAYILYTSGSTGQPKGVEISQAALSHYVNWAADYYGKDTEPLSFPLFTPLTFDLTITSIFVPLVTGGRIVVYPETAETSDVALLEVIKDDLVDIIKLTPSHLSLLEGQRLKSTRVRQLILGGENLKVEQATRILNNFPDGVVIHNEYGPTEATVGCIVYSLDTNTRLTGTSVPIGRPIPGMQAYVLNRDLQPQPAGVVGELYVAGHGLAIGFHGQPELTAQKFIESPFRADTRLYQTGDMARFNDDGILEYLGRQDHQIKIRGARIELGAIESALAEHPDISRAVVTTFAPRNEHSHLDYCANCGLASNFPEIEFDSRLVCNHCREFEDYREKAAGYFKSMDDLKNLFDAQVVRPNSQYDCLALLSGGKDSTYMLARLAEMNLRILAFTLDNGFISEEAKANIRRVVKVLGVDHQFGSTSAMNEIFVDSLKRFSNVCQGCFKTIYTLSMNIALEKNIPLIVTGLSRGQFFETRLTKDLFQDPCANLVQIDQAVLDARKAYHRVDDAVSKLLDVSKVQNAATFEQVQYVDFYRYCDVGLDEMLDYLRQRLPWIRPGDTGRSTNCLINDVGIYVHKRNMGYHNYALPYAWDVRLGHKLRDAALNELNDDIDVENVHRILNEIGYDGELEITDEGDRLVAYYTGSQKITSVELKEHLKRRLPNFMIPARYVRLSSIPVSANGKVDLSALPDPTESKVKTSVAYVAPSDELETRLAAIWREVLRVPKVGVRDNFFDLGGDSILAIQIVARANRAGIRITPSHLFDTLTVKKLAQAWRECDVQQSAGDDEEPILTPIQMFCLECQPGPSDHWNQSIEIRLPDGPSPSVVEAVRQSLVFLTNFHRALRTMVSPDGKVLPLPTIAQEQLLLLTVSLEDTDHASVEQVYSQIHGELNQKINFGSNVLLGGAIVSRSAKDHRLLMVANHLAIDAVSWHRLIEDFKVCYRAFTAASIPELDATPTFANWSKTLKAATAEDRFTSQLDYWISALRVPPPFPKSIPISAIGFPVEFASFLSGSQTRQLEADLRRSRVSMHELLLAAFAKSLSTWSGQEEFRVFLESHGREPIRKDVDFSRTVGWFTSLSPLRLSIPRESSPGPTLQRIKEHIRAVPDHGIGYGMLRYLSDDPAVRHSLKTNVSEVVFNYLGKASRESGETPFSVSQRLQLHRSPSLRRFASLEANIVVEDRLRIELVYDPGQFDEPRIQLLANEFVGNIEVMADYCAGEGAGQATISDFPLAKLDARQLDDLASLLNQRDSKDGGRK